MANEDISTATCDTYEVKIYCGRRAAYSDVVHPLDRAMRVIRAFTDKVRTGVTVTETTYAYVGGDEPGIVVGFINYPRFPKGADRMRADAFRLAGELMLEMEQVRVSIVTPVITTTLTNLELVRKLGDMSEGPSNK